MNDVYLLGAKAAFFFMAAILFATALLTAKLIFIGIGCITLSAAASIECYLALRK